MIEEGAAAVPQEFLADFTAATEEIVKANEATPEEIDDTSDQLPEPPDGQSYRRCEDCGQRFLGKGHAKLCRKCWNQRIRIGKQWSKAKGMRPEDVPKCPSDDYMSEEERRKKTAPIEAHFGPYVPDTARDERLKDLERAREERLKDFPSCNNRLAQREAAAAAAAAEEDVHVHTLPYIPAGTTAHVDGLPNTATTDTKLLLLDMYKDMASKCGEMGLSVGAVCQKLQALDTMLNTLGA